MKAMKNCCVTGMHGQPYIDLHDKSTKGHLTANQILFGSESQVHCALPIPQVANLLSKGSFDKDVAIAKVHHLQPRGLVACS